MGASARQAARVQRPPFLLRPGLVAEMLRFHDQIERLGHDAVGLAREAAAQLEDEAPSDRGAERLLLQTPLPAGSVSGLRRARRAISRAGRARPARRRCGDASRPWCPPHVVVDRRRSSCRRRRPLAGGPGVARRRHPASRASTSWRRAASPTSLFARLRRLWPLAADVRVPRQRPSDTRLEVTSTERRWIGCRDRDEEVLSYARRVKALQPADASATALVYRRPLPYLYAAQFVLERGRHPVPVFRHAAAGGRAVGGRPRPADGRRALRFHAGGAGDGAAFAARAAAPRGRDARAGRPTSPPSTRWLARQRYLGTLDHLDHLRTLPPAAPPHEGDPDARTPIRRRVAAGARRPRRGRRRAAVARAADAAAGAWHPAPITCAPCATHGAPASDCRTTTTRRRAGPAARVLRSTCCSISSSVRSPRTTRHRCRRATPASSFVAGSKSAPSRCRATTRACISSMPTRRRTASSTTRASSACSKANGRRRRRARSSIPAFMLERLGWAEERTRTGALRARFADLLDAAGDSGRRLRARTRSGRRRPAVVAARRVAGRSAAIAWSRCRRTSARLP